MFSITCLTQLVCQQENDQIYCYFCRHQANIVKKLATKKCHKQPSLISSGFMTTPKIYQKGGKGIFFYQYWCFFVARLTQLASQQQDQTNTGQLMFRVYSYKLCSFERILHRDKTAFPNLSQENKLSTTDVRKNIEAEFMLRVSIKFFKNIHRYCNGANVNLMVVK